MAAGWARRTLAITFGRPKKSLVFLVAQSMPIKLALPQAAWLSLFYRKISSVAPPRGT